MKFEKPDHIGVAVKDIEKAKTILRENFDAELIQEMESAEEGFRTALVSSGGIKFELIAPLHEKSMIANFINQRGEGIHHLSFQMEDLPSTTSYLEEHGFSTIKQPSKIPGFQTVFVHPKSFFGILVELFQKMDLGSY